MKFIIVIVLAISLLLNACNAATGIEISNPWARPALKDGNGAVYFLLKNHSAAVDELTGVSSEVAQTTEIHESKMEGDVMQMRQVASLPIQEKESIEFGPGGYHVMLVGLNQELKAGDEIQITLHFEGNEDILVTVPVQEMAPESEIGEH
jgi:copper(I)-binding protein